MSANSPPGKRPLTAEEAELWAFAMREAKALRRERDKHDASLRAGPAPKRRRPRCRQTAPRQHGFVREERCARGASQTGRTARRAIKSPPPLARYNERERRKLARDADLIDARLDLHGMRQREAHGALKRFLLACHTRGDRHVLVITGKGAPGESGGIGHPTSAARGARRVAPPRAAMARRARSARLRRQLRHRQRPPWRRGRALCALAQGGGCWLARDQVGCAASRTDVVAASRQLSPQRGHGMNWQSLIWLQP